MLCIESWTNIRYNFAEIINLHLQKLPPFFLMKCKILHRSSISHPLDFRSSLGLPTAITLTLLAAAVSQLGAQTVRSWNGSTGGAWLTGANWSPSGTFAGGAPLANPAGEGANTDIMSVVAANAASNVGINMNTLNAGAGGVSLVLGGIDFSKTNSTALQIGNSSGTSGSNGILQLNGATINSVANTLIRVAGSANLTIADVNTGSGTQTMGLSLGTANGILEVATGRTLTISSIISEAASNSGFTKTGAGTLVLTRANTFSGPVAHNGGIINITNASALGDDTFTFGGYNRLQINVADGASMTVANNMVLSSTGAGGENELIRVGDGTATAGTTARLTGIISGGTAGQVYTLVDSDQGGNHNHTLVLDNAANTFSGTVEIWRGTLAFTSDGALGNVNNTIIVNAGNNNGGLRFDANNITTASTRTFNLVGSEKIDTNGNNARIDGVISGLNFTKVGAGTLTLAGTNTYTGTTTINVGTLALSGGAAIANTSAVSLANTAGVNLQLDASETIASIAGGGTTGGNINLQANTLSLAGTAVTSFAGTISGTGGVVTKTSTSTGTLTLTGTNTYTGGTNLNGGALSLSNGSAAGTGAITIGTGATSGTGGSVSTILVNNTAATTLANNIALAAPAVATTYTLMKATASASTGTQLNLTGDISGGNANSTFRLNSNTAGDNTTTYRLAGNNSFQGNLELYRGAIVVTNDNSLGSAKLLLNGNNNATLGDLRFENSVTLANDIDLVNTANPDPIHTGGNTVTLSGVISATGSQNLVKIGTGTLILTGANTYGVGTTVSAGTLQIGNGGTTGNLGSGAVTNNAALVFNRSNNFSVSTTISGSGTVTKEGDGIMTLLGTNTYTGNTIVNDGTLAVNGTASASAFTVNNGGTVIGTGTVGALTVANGGRIGPGNSPGILNTGSINLQSGGILDIELNGATAGTGYDQLNVTGSVTLAGQLSVTMGFTPIENSLFFILLNDGSDVINGTFTGLANESVFKVSGQEFRISYFADRTGNTFTGGNDVALMAIPEPSTSLLAGFALTALLIRRRR
jgi:autotransporter-associated beta strand protein